METWEYGKRRRRPNRMRCKCPIPKALPCTSGTNTLARKIIEVARTGERDPDGIRQQALEPLGRYHRAESIGAKEVSPYSAKCHEFLCSLVQMPL